MAAEEGRPLTPSIVAQRLGVHRDKVYEWIESGLLRAYNRSLGKQRPTWVIYEQDVIEFDAKCATLAGGAETTGGNPEKPGETRRNQETQERKMPEKPAEACASA